jgi:hypothetical protein
VAHRNVLGTAPGYRCASGMGHLALKPRSAHLRSASSRAVLGLVVLLILLLGGGIVLSNRANDPGVFGLALVVGVVFGAVGIPVAWREPRNAIGWILLALPILVAVSSDAAVYSILAYRVDGHGLPLSPIAVALAPSWVWLQIALPLPILLFPDGRLPPGRWRWTFWVYVLLAASEIVAVFGVGAFDAATHHHIHIDSIGQLTSLDSASPGFQTYLQDAMIGAYILIPFSWVVRLLIDYHRSTGDYRQQLKWLMCGASICIVGVISGALSNNSGGIVDTIGSAAFLGILALPASLAIGILKYRLYEIDRLISRTISYLIVTGLLVGIFVSIVVLATRVLPVSSPVAVAASTLAAAALFNTLRQRVQRIVDRRFNRARYDAEATLAAFTARLRDAVDLETVQRGLLEGVDQALSPAHVSLWIRPPGSARRA